MVEIVKMDPELTISYWKGLERDAMIREDGLEKGRAEERKNTEVERQKAEVERQKAEAERQRAEKAEEKIVMLEEMLRKYQEG